MKTLIALSIIQFAAILLLYTRVADLDDRMTGSPAAQQASVGSDVAGAPIPRNPVGTNDFTSEDRLRQIIREELTAHVENPSPPGSQATQPKAPASVDPVEMEARREQISQQLEYYTSVGSISDAEMQQLQIDIARLDAKGRTEMLRELTRALNSGRLEGRL